MPQNSAEELKIIGQWLNSDTPETLVFNSDNSGNFSANNQINITWTIDTTILNVNWGNSIISYTYSITSNSLSIDWDNDDLYATDEIYSKQ